MTSEGPSVENENGLQETQEETPSNPSPRTSNSVISDDGTSATSTDDSFFGSVKPRRPKQSCHDSSSLTLLTETDATELCKFFGRDWQSLGRELKFSKTTLDDISDDKSNHSHKDKAHDLLMKFIHQHGSDATKGRLVEALFKIERQDIARKLRKEYFVITTPQQQQSFYLKEEGRFANQDKNGELILICKDKEGNLYCLKKFVGPKLENYKKFKQSLERKQEIEDVEAKIRKIEESVRGLQNTFERQEVQRGKIEVGLQLDEDEEKLEKVHALVFKLVRLAEAARHLQEPSVPKSQIFDLCNTLSAVRKDMEERVKKLLEKTERDDETLRLNKLSKCCLSLRKAMDEEIYFGSLKDLTHQMRETRLLSAPTPSTKVKVSDDSLTHSLQRLNTMPKSEREKRELAEQTSPPKEPMEIRY